MRFHSYKKLLEHLNEEKEVIVGLSLWTYSSKRIRVRVPFTRIKKFFDGDMIHNAYSRRMSFTTVEDKKYTFREYTLKIAKVDYVEY